MLARLPSYGGIIRTALGYHYPRVASLTDEGYFSRNAQALAPLQYYSPDSW